MAPIPLPRRGARSLLILAILIWVSYQLIKKLNNAAGVIEEDDYNDPYRATPKGKSGKVYPKLHPDELDPALALGVKQKKKVSPPPPKIVPGRDVKEVKKSKKNVLPPHKYLENGLLQVNPKGQHPIYDMLAKGKEVWEGKLEKASTTLGQAVNEYRRRYGRAPPKGFDRW